MLAICYTCVRAALKVELPISARTDEVKSDWSTVVYDVKNPILVGNDGGAASGGLRFFDLKGDNPIPEKKHQTPGRTKLVATAYGIQGKDVIVTIAQTDSFFRVYDASTLEQIGQPLGQTLGDWSALCAWKSQSSGEQYLYLFGKGQAVQLLLRGRRGSLVLTEIQTFKTPVEASSCAVSLATSEIFFSGDDSPAVYVFGAAESTTVPDIKVLGKAEDDVTGLAVYIGSRSDYLIVAQEDVAAVYDTSFKLLGTLLVTGDEDIEIQGLSFYQGIMPKYPAGVLAYAVESKAGTGFGVSSLSSAFKALSLEVNTAYNPRKTPRSPVEIVSPYCNSNGFCQASSRVVSAPSCSVGHFPCHYQTLESK